MPDQSKDSNIVGLNSSHESRAPTLAEVLRLKQAAPMSPECPAEEEWMDLAAGLFKEQAAAEALVEHAAVCSYCGPLFKAFLEDFADPPPEVDNFRALFRSYGDDGRLDPQRLLRSLSDDGSRELAARLSQNAKAAKRDAKPNTLRTSRLKWLRYFNVADLVHKLTRRRG